MIVNISTLTLNPEEATSVSQFLITALQKQPALSQLFELQTGIKMKQQIVLVKSLEKVGVKANGCEVVTSGASTSATEKFWDPANIKDTLEFCQADIDKLWKPYYSKIKEYAELYDASGSEELMFISSLVLAALVKTITRAAYFGDTAVAVSGAAASGLVNAADIKFYNYFDGIFKQLFAAVTAGTVTRVTIAENALATKAAQTTLAPGRAVEILDEMWEKASIDLRADEGAEFRVSREIFDNLLKYYRDHRVVYDAVGAQGMLLSVMHNGRPVINMETVWDATARQDFEATNAHTAYYAPLRATLTTKANTPLGTLSENGLSDLKVWFNVETEKMKLRFGFTLDAKVVDENMVVVAY